MTYVQLEVIGKVVSKANFRKGRDYRKGWSRVKQYENQVGYAAIAAGAPKAGRLYGERAVAVEIILYNQIVDADNACKSILDPLQGLAFKSDAQVRDLRVRKLADDYGPRAVVKIEYLEAA